MKRLTVVLIIFSVLVTCHSLLFAQMTKDEQKLLKLYTKYLKSDDESERYEAAESLQYYKYPEVIPLLTSALKDSSASVRNRAALSFYEWKEAARPAIPVLMEGLRDSDAFVRINCGATLLNLDVEESKVLPAIQELLQRPEPLTQVAAVRFLQGSVPDSDLLPVLSRALKNPDPSIRVEASDVLADTKEPPAEALPLLVEALKDHHPKVRENVAIAIGKFKTKGASALPALLPLLQDSEPDVRSEALDAIEEMGTWAKDALPQIYEVIRKDPDPRVRKSALNSLEWIDPEGRTVMPILIEALKDKDPEVRQKSMETILSVRPFPHQSVPAIQSALAGETNEQVKLLLGRAIERGEQEKKYEASGQGGAKVTLPSTPKKGTNAMPREDAMRLLQERGIQMTTDEFWRHVNDGDVDVVKAMLSAGFPANTEQQGSSVLLIAAGNHDGSPEKKEILKALIEYGADVNYRNENNVTPFFEAAGTCDAEILSMMIKAGAILEVQAKGGATALTQAAMSNKVENVRLLLKSGYKLKNEPTWLMNATKNPEILALLRKAGAK